METLLILVFHFTAKVIPYFQRKFCVFVVRWVGKRKCRVPYSPSYLNYPHFLMVYPVYMRPLCNKMSMTVPLTALSSISLK